jgi:serine/threonine protein kinase
MIWDLPPRDNIIHGDLKASNVHIIHGFAYKKIDLVNNRIDCILADFECSVGVVGTRYWRAPEILQALENCAMKADLFTKK